MKYTNISYAIYSVLKQDFFHFHLSKYIYFLEDLIFILLNSQGINVLCIINFYQVPVVLEELAVSDSFTWWILSLHQTLSSIEYIILWGWICALKISPMNKNVPEIIVLFAVYIHIILIIAKWTLWKINVILDFIYLF